MATITNIKSVIILVAFAMAAVVNANAQQQDTVQMDQGNWYVVTRGEKGAVIGMRQIDAPKTTTPKVAPSKEEVDSVVNAVQAMLGDKYKVTAAKDTTAAPAAPAKTISGRQAAMNIGGKEMSKGCAHMKIYGDTPANRAKNRVGKIEVSNCCGFMASLGPAADLMWGESELGNFSDQSYGGEVELAYRWHMLTPYVRFFKGSNMTMDGCEARTENWTVGLKFSPAYHWVVAPYVAVDYCLRNTSSHKEASIPGYELNLPYKGKAGSFGGEFGLDFYLGGFKHQKTFSDGEHRYTYYGVNKCYLTLFLNYHHNEVEKLRTDEVESIMKLNTFHTGVKFSVLF